MKLTRLLAAAVLALAPAALPAGAAGPAPARAVLLDVGASLPPGMLGESVSTRVPVRALVSPAGLVDSARAVSGEAGLREAAEDAVRWWVFAPAKRREWVDVTVPVAASADAPGLFPDVLAIARRSEADGDLPTALAAWVGALERAGRSPVVENDWVLREHAIAVARRMPAPPALASVVGNAGLAARSEQLRAVARGSHAALVPKFDGALAAAPWWAEPWMWRAGSLAGCGRSAEALRSLRAYRLAATDSAGVAFADQMVARLAAADTVGVCEAIKNWNVVTEPRRR